MIGQNFLKECLEKKKSALGSWCIIDSPTVVDIISSTGIDFLIIDAEHGPISFETAQHMVRACVANGVSPVMRVGEINESLILRALDIGIHGLQIPNIVSREAAEAMVRFSKYPPYGERGFSPYTKAGLYDRVNGKRLAEEANSNTLLIANVESEAAITSLEDISSVDMIDVLFIGLFDLSKSLGVPGDVTNKKVINYLKKSVDIVHSKGKMIGSIAADVEMLALFQEIGVDYITYSVDSGMIKDAYKNIVSSYNSRIIK